MACNDPRSWIYTLLLRAVALFINIVCLVLLGIGFPRGMLIHLILFSIVGLWSLVEFTLLICKCNHHPGVNVGLDLISFLVFVIMSLIGLSVFVDLGFRYDNGTALRVGVVLGFVSALFYLILFIRACIHTHQKRRESKRSDWEMSKMNKV